MVRGGLIEMDAEVYLVWPKVNPFILRHAQDERIYFYKALLSEVEGTLIEEVGQLYIHYISHRAKNLLLPRGEGRDEGVTIKRLYPPSPKPSP